MINVPALTKPHALAGLAAKLPALFLPDDKTAERFFGFFTANIRNKNTRRAYYKAACRFADWWEGRGLGELASVKPVHVAAYIEELQGELAKPYVKQHLAALRMLFDWLVVGHALEVNPAHAVRGTKSGLRRARREGKILGRPRVAIDVEKVRKLQTQGLGLRGIAAETGWSLSSIVRALKAA